MKHCFKKLSQFKRVIAKLTIQLTNLTKGAETEKLYE